MDGFKNQFGDITEIRSVSAFPTVSEPTIILDDGTFNRRASAEDVSQDVQDRSNRETERITLLGERYTLEEVLGRGGMATVYRGADLVTGRPIAVKILAKNEHNRGHVAERFAAEAQALKMVKHPGVVELYDFGNHEGHAYAVLEYAPGGSLHDLVCNKGALRWRLATKMLGQVLRGLDVAHKLNIVHRDIKPANVLFDDRGRALLADFGIARVPGSKHETEIGLVMGSRSFMAPELWAGCEYATPISDVYSVGATMAWVLTGMKPNGLWVQPPDSPSWQAIPRQIRPIIRKAMDAYPEKRHQTAGEFADDLDEI